MKQARKVANIHIADYPRDEYTAHWHIVVLGDDEQGYQWKAQIMSTKPVGYMWQGQFHKEWPKGLPRLAVPTDEHLLRQEAYLKLSPADKLREQARQEDFRAACAAHYESQPKAEHLLDEAIDACRTRDEADTAAQAWVASKMEQYRRSKADHAPKSYALPLPLDMLPWFDIKRALRRFARKAVRDFLIFTLGLASTLRNNRAQAIIDYIDAGAGAGKWRIYNSTRPATCGTATTLLAELTCSDPSGTKSGGVLTFSAITQDSSADNTGTASWYRIVDSTGTCCLDGSVGTSGSDLNLDSTSITAGQVVQITSATITEGNA